MSIYYCPCCKKPLEVEVQPDGVRLYCGHGPCPCNEMNDGESGENAEEAYLKLVHQFELWENLQPE
jgi:hypothetical protein